MQKEKFKHIENFCLSGFDGHKWYGGLSHRSIKAAPLECQFSVFKERVLKALGKEYLPIYRMADGEFNMLLTNNFFSKQGRGGSFGAFLVKIIRLIKKVFLGVRTCWGEKYNILELNKAIGILENSIREIASTGILALYFAMREDLWGQQYFEPMCEWFESREIEIKEKNFIPFYFVYALLASADSVGLFEGQDVYVFTYLTDEREGRIRKGIESYGPRKIGFYPLSQSKAIFDIIDLNKIQFKPSLVLVAAGIGSASIIKQLHTLSCPCIDAGIGIECFIDPEKRKERPFLEKMESNKQ